MIPFFDQMNAMQAWMRFNTAYTQMAMAAGEVIMRRSIMMAQGSMTGAEAIGMVLEKSSAFALATERAAVAAATGKDALHIASAALAPISARTRSNVRKLRR